MILENAEGIKKQIFFVNPKVDDGNAILLELENFADAILMNKEPAVTLNAGASALEVAFQILNCFYICLLPHLKLSDLNLIR